jgi:outer membrane receptor for ferric coprogen and ferric-rhodotorulic acid
MQFYKKKLNQKNIMDKEYEKNHDNNLNGHLRQFRIDIINKD